jgi:hypothetical protein
LPSLLFQRRKNLSIGHVNRVTSSGYCGKSELKKPYLYRCSLQPLA